jgi:hypothetical protein
MWYLTKIHSDIVFMQMNEIIFNIEFLAKFTVAFRKMSNDWFPTKNYVKSFTCFHSINKIFLTELTEFLYKNFNAVFLKMKQNKDLCFKMDNDLSSGKSITALCWIELPLNILCKLLTFLSTFLRDENLKLHFSFKVDTFFFLVLPKHSLLKHNGVTN